MKLDPEARYAESHEWARWEGDEIVCGITDHAQDYPLRRRLRRIADGRRCLRRRRTVRHR